MMVLVAGVVLVSVVVVVVGELWIGCRNIKVGWVSWLCCREYSCDIGNYAN